MDIKHKVSPQNVKGWLFKEAQCINVLNSVPASIAYIDAAFRYHYVNAAFEDLIGKPKNEILGATVLEIPGGELYHLLKENIPSALNGSTHFEYTTDLADELQVADITIIPDFDLYNNPKGNTLFGNNITEQKRLIKKVYQNERRYRELIEKLPIAIYTCDSQGHIQMYNKAAVELWGREPESGKDMWCGSWRIYQPNGAPLSLDLCPMAIALKEGRAVYGEEIVIERPYGKRLNVEPFPQPILDTDGNVLGAVNMLVDITERKKAEEVNAKLAAIVQSSDDAIVSKTLEGIVTSWNNAAQRIFGYSAEEMVGQSITKIIPPERQDEEPKILEQLKRGERVDHFETERIAKDGRRLTLSLTISPVKDIRGKIIGASKIARDITEQKKIFGALRESEERFRTVANTAPVMIWLTGTDSLCYFVNKEWLEFTGGTQESETGSGWIKRIHPDEVEKAQQIYKSCFEARKEFQGEFRLRKKDGEYRWMFSRGQPRFSPAGAFLGYIGTCSDIHERKAASTELEKLVNERTAALQMANHHLEKSNQELERFAYVASHDLQEPLRKIQAFGDLILERNAHEFTASGKDYLTRMIKSANRMQSLIEALLEFSRATTPQKNFEKKDLTALTEEVRTEFRETIEEKKATVNIASLPTMPIIPFQFKQMLSNIVSNALKYTKAGEAPVINVKGRTIQGKDINKKGVKQNLDYCEITIEDNGIGFDKENSERIFELFQRLHGRHEYSGSGIGLSICKKIAENHNGFIIAEAAKGKGAAFHIYIPMQQN
jgi:PAS domain S-box-containing protein